MRTTKEVHVNFEEIMRFDASPPSKAALCRRAFLGRGVSGLGVVALNSLLQRNLLAAAESTSRGVVNPLHHAAKAKRVIFLYQAGGPSHLETFDYKPVLATMHAKPMPESLTKGQQIAHFRTPRLLCFGPQYQFQQIRKVRSGDLRVVPAHRQCGRRHLHCALHVDRAD